MYDTYARFIETGVVGAVAAGAIAVAAFLWRQLQSARKACDDERKAKDVHIEKLHERLLEQSVKHKDEYVLAMDKNRETIKSLLDQFGV